ncbi:MAG: NfeD family protein [Lachnospiraceae bacterium]|nr:NfeD family protein [Lachnospiraceae bacterium]
MVRWAVFWLILFVVLAGFEFATVALTSIWFACGALLAFLLALANVPLAFQWTAFIVLSLVLLFFTRPLAVKHFNTKRTATNIDAMVGRLAKVTKDISNIDETGSALLGGQPWTARSLHDDEVIKAGTEVTVMKIEGAKLIVKPVDGAASAK